MVSVTGAPGPVHTGHPTDPSTGQPPGSVDPQRGGAAERGAGTVLVLGSFALVVLTAALAVLVGQAATIRHRADAAADLAALAAARAGADNVPLPCRAARVVAERNDARVTACAVTGGDARVSVVVTGSGLGRRVLRAAGTAQARPVG